MPDKRAKSRRKPGRPAGQEAEEVRQGLLEAAGRLFAVRGYAAVSLRQVAAEAGANPAMIHYYFGDKQGLYEAVLSTAFEPLFQRLADWSEHADTENAGVRGFLEVYIPTIAANPWIPPLIMREVLSEQGRFRERFIEQFAKRGSGLLTRAITREKGAGHLRGDLDPKLAALSLVSMSLFPFIAYPIASRVFGVKRQRAFLDRLIDHTERMFLEGGSA